MAEVDLAPLIAALNAQTAALRENFSAITASVSSSSPNNGKPHLLFEKFNETAESFDDYLDRLNAYFTLQGIKNEAKVKMLISLLSPKHFTLLKSLLYPETFDQKSFEEVTTILRKHLSPKPLIIVSRHQFLNRKQHEGESLATYVSELRKLAANCGYNAQMLDAMLRDVFVSGIHSRQILDRLFEEDDVPFEKVLNLALAMEKAFNGATEMMLKPKESSFEVKKLNKFKSRYPSAPQTAKANTSPNSSVIKCNKCGKNHFTRSCRVRNLHCTFCDKDGHVVEVCFRKRDSQAPTQSFKKGTQRPKNSSVKQLQEEDFDDIYPIKVLRSNVTDGCPPIMVNVNINGKTIPMEIDSGSKPTVIAQEKFDEIPNTVLRPTPVRLRDFRGNMTIPIGVAEVNVSFRGKKRRLDLFVVKEDYDTLFGREWMLAFDLLDFANITEVKSLSTTANETVSNLLNEFQPTFSKKVGAVQNYTCSLHPKPGCKPIFQKARTPPWSLKPAIEKEICSLVQEGVLKPVEFSDWASPSVPVVKPDLSVRLCGDYSGTVNPQIDVTQHPFKGYDEVSASLTGGKKFSTLDVRTAFLHLPVDDESSKMLTLNTHRGLFQPTRLFYGVSAAPALWQRYMDSVFNLDGVCVVHDDIIITGQNDAEHINRLRQVLEICKRNNIHLNREKCKLLQEEVKFLGFKIDQQGTHKTNEKVNAIVNARNPENESEVKTFLGLVTFYSRFCPNLATMAEPLNNLTRNATVFEWTDECQRSFDSIKSEIASERILMRYDPTLPVLLSVDASPVGIGAVLAHQVDGMERPILFASHSLNRAERNYSQIDREALAIKWGVEKFAHYLFGRKFTLITDHQPLVHIFGPRKKLPPLSVTRLQHYALYLQMFTFDIKYRKSADNANADFLSRFPFEPASSESIDQAEIYQLAQVNNFTVTAKDIGMETLADPDMKTLYEQLRSGECSDGKFTLQGRCILYGIRVYIPSKYRPHILNELHDGHIGVVRMKNLARSFAYWPKIDSDIESMVRNCPACMAVSKAPNHLSAHFWEYPISPWHRIHMDFAGPFFERNFLVVVDAYSKWPEVFVMTQITVLKTSAVLDGLFSRFGNPRTIVTDNGPTFTGKDFQEFLRLRGIKHITSAPFHPASNGQAERYVATLKDSLRSLRQFPGTLDEKVNKFLLSYRRAPHSTTSETPAKLFLGREIRTKLDLIKPNMRENTENKFRKAGGCKIPNYEIGDHVAIRSYNDRSKKWIFGQVSEREGPFNYVVNSEGRSQRRHLEQMRPVGKDIPTTPTAINLGPFIKNESSDNTTLGSSEVPSDRGEAATPTQPILRRSARTRRPVQRLNL